MQSKREEIHSYDQRDYGNKCVTIPLARLQVAGEYVYNKTQDRYLKSVPFKNHLSDIKAEQNRSFGTKQRIQEKLNIISINSAIQISRDINSLPEAC